MGLDYFDKKFGDEDKIFIAFTLAFTAIAFSNDFRKALVELSKFTELPIISAFLKYAPHLWWILAILFLFMSTIRFWAIIIESEEWRFYSIDLFFLSLYIFLLIISLPLSAIYSWFIMAIIGFPYVFESDTNAISVFTMLLFFLFWIIFAMYFAYYLKEMEDSICRNSKYYYLFTYGRIRKLVPSVAKFVIYVLSIFIILLILYLGEFIRVLGIMIVFILGPLILLDRARNKWQVCKNLITIYMKSINRIVE